MKYDLDYFIHKFSAIPEERWTTGKYVDDNGCKCALGHLGESMIDTTEESKQLTWLVYDIDEVNDNRLNKYSHYGTTPKQRVVNYLKSLRDK